MAKLLKGNIFNLADENDLTVVFGHIGFNLMSQSWKEFTLEVDGLNSSDNPFEKFSNDPKEWKSGKWFWFVPEEENHGMSDNRLIQTLDKIFTWAESKGIREIACNGIMDIDHSMSTDSNNESNMKRAAFLKQYCEEAEKKHGFEICLISLNDTFLKL